MIILPVAGNQSLRQVKVPDHLISPSWPGLSRP